MELVSTMEINGEEREIADAYAREQIDGVNSNLDCQQDFVGKELLFNQHSQMVHVPTDRNGLTFKYNQENNTCIIDGTTTNTYDARGWFGLSFLSEKCELITNHKYLVMLKTISGSFPTSFQGDFSGNTVFQNSAKIINLNYTTGNVFSISWAINSVFNNAEFYILVVDLTKMYGSGKEPTDAENIAKFFTENYPKISSLPISNYGISKQINESLSVIGKCKNLINATIETATSKGITFTKNGDGTYTVNGTATGQAFFYLDTVLYDIGKTYKLVGCPEGGSTEYNRGYFLSAISADEQKFVAIDGGEGVSFKPEEYSGNIRLYVNNGTTCNNLVFKPMLTEDLSATYDDFVPYTGDGETLTADVASLKNDLSKQCKKDDITTNETLIGTFNGKNYYRRLFTGIGASGSSVTVNVGEKIEIYNYYGRAYVYGQSGASDVKYPIPNNNYYIESQNASETSFQLTIPTSSDMRKIDLVIEYTKVDE